MLRLLCCAGDLERETNDVTFPSHLDELVIVNTKARSTRYEIEGDAPGWEDAEKQVQSASKRGRGAASGVVVSVKSEKKAKRKAGETAGEIYEKALGEKTKKGKKRQRTDE